MRKIEIRGAAMKQKSKKFLQSEPAGQHDYRDMFRPRCQASARRSMIPIVRSSKCRFSKNRLYRKK